MRFSRKEILWHVLGWAFYLFIQATFFQLSPGPFLLRLKLELLELPLKMAAFYFAVGVLVNGLLAHQKYRLFLVTLVAYVLVVAVLDRAEEVYLQAGQSSAMALNEVASRVFWDWNAIFHHVSDVFLVVGMGVAVYLERAWQAEKVEIARLAREKTEAELLCLKKQMHPHILYNALNHLYARNQSPQAPETVLRLSDVLSYMTNDCQQDLVPVQKEWELIRNYAELEKLNLEHQLDLKMTDNGLEPQFMVAPCLLLPFVENAFKHGNTMGTAWVRMDLEVVEGELIFRIENRLPDYPAALEEKHSGKGLLNVRKRLELLYPQRFVLKIQAYETYYVKLQIKL